MGLVKAAFSAITGNLRDQWKEIIESGPMGGSTVFTSGINVNGTNKRTSIITDTSIIRIYDNQFMILTDGGKIVDYSAEPGYYTVDNASAPSVHNGQFLDSIKESFSRIQYAGVPSKNQKVFFINLAEIRGVKFGTRNPVNYFDDFYNSELFLRMHGTYSIKITDPIRFYQEVVPRDSISLDFGDIADDFASEFLNGLQSSINQLSADGNRISHVTSKGRELSEYMSKALDEEWKQARGFEILQVGIASVSYDASSQELINMRNRGAMLSDPLIREGYVQGSVARGIEAAGSNESGAISGIMGMGMTSTLGSGVIGSMSASNNEQIKQEKEVQTLDEGNVWKCKQGHNNSQISKFCGECGQARSSERYCNECNTRIEKSDAKFCANCGAKVVV